MSDYTIELRHICESYAGREETGEYADIDSIISAALPKVFDFSFPIFDENYRTVLESKILMHYWMREIGFETVGQWKLKLRATLNEIMPYYNKLYESELIEFNPLYDTDITREHTITNEETRNTDASTDTETEHSESTNTNIDTEGQGTNTGTASSHTQDKGQNYDRYSDTPQGNLTNIQNDTYLTNARVIDNTNNTQVTSENGNNYNDNSETTSNSDTERNTTTRTDTEENHRINGMEEYIETVKGKNGGVTFSKALQEFRDTFLNIDMMVINELNDLFLLIW